MLGTFYAAVDSQAEAGVFFISAVSVRHAQFAFGEFDHGLRFAHPVVSDTTEGDDVGDKDDGESGDQNFSIVFRVPTPCATGCSALRKRLSMTRHSIATRLSTRKNRYLGITSHHQSKNLV